jgi:hypothetical protein
MPEQLRSHEDTERVTWLQILCHEMQTYTYATSTALHNLRLIPFALLHYYVLCQHTSTLPAYQYTVRLCLHGCSHYHQYNTSKCSSNSSNSNSITGSGGSVTCSSTRAHAI